MPRKIRTPQEKKALSLKKDTRQAYFANGQKTARKSIPLRKRLENRRNRHKNDQAIAVAVTCDETLLALAESSARHNVHRARGWRKHPDRPLGEAIASQQAKRGWRFGRKDQSRLEQAASKLDG